MAFNTNTLEIVSLVVLILCFTAQMLYYWVVLAKPLYYVKNIARKKSENLTAQPPVSVIIPLIDSQHDLSRLLSPVLEQEYPKFEVIVVTGGISDEEEEILTRLKNRYSNLYSTRIPVNTKNLSRQKLAITLGIKAAKYNKLLFTEHDSSIRSEHWISFMARHFSDKKTIVLGFSASEPGQSFWSKYKSYDYFFSNLQMISFALLKHPYSGNGRNMAYSKDHFIEHKGFIKHLALQQGEDDLFINEIASGENTAVELSDQSVTMTDINESDIWKRQKIDRMLTKHFYKWGPGAFWRSEIYTRIIFFSAVIICFIYGLPYTSSRDFLLAGIALFFLIVRLFSQLFIINKIVERLRLKKFYLAIIPFDVLQPFIDLYFYIYQILTKKDNYTYRYEKR